MSTITMIDALGLGCPKPVLMAEEALSAIDEGLVEILVDNEASVMNLTRFAAKNGFHAESAGEDGRWRVKIVKGYVCEVPEQAETPWERRKDLLLVIGTDALGRDEDLGRMLMKGFLETIKVTKEIPHTLFLLNTGVRLSTTNTETTAVLRDLDAMGVEIFSCGTCLKHYDLESELKVGYRGTTNHIVEGMKDFEKTVWIG